MWDIWLQKALPAEVRRREVVLAMSKLPRLAFLYDRKPLGELLQGQVGAAWPSPAPNRSLGQSPIGSRLQWPTCWNA